jgi:hypothetical protein
MVPKIETSSEARMVCVVLNVRKRVVTSILLLILGSTFVLVAVCPTRAQSEHSIELTGYTRDHSTITVTILPSGNESWWKQSYLEAILRGIDQWNDAIQEYVANYTDFSHLSTVRLIPTLNYENVSGFDIYISWIAECGSEATIGQSRATVQSPCVMVNNTVCLAAKAPSGHVMTDVDMQNIVVHELGHAFGLYHSSYSGDVMYSIVDYSETVKPLSSLDLYALSKSFEWLTNSTQFTASSTCPEESTVTLPSGISYIHFPIAAGNLPFHHPQSLAEYVVELFLLPKIIAPILIAVILLVVAVWVFKRRKKP